MLIPSWLDYNSHSKAWHPTHSWSALRLLLQSPLLLISRHIFYLSNIEQLSVNWTCCFILSGTLSPSFIRCLNSTYSRCSQITHIPRTSHNSFPQSVAFLLCTVTLTALFYHLPWQLKQWPFEISGPHPWKLSIWCLTWQKGICRCD